jgi:phosphatidylserine decarboxylase
VSASFSDRLKVWPQYLLPRHLLTALAWRLSTCRAGWIRRPFMTVFVRLFGVDLSEAERADLADYECFNDFFTRALKPGARPLADERHRMVSPSDGTISRLGRLSDGAIVQAKGIDYSAAELLGSETRAAPFADGHFITVYLAPRDYHRVHSPIAGHVVEEVRIPGELFSVSAATVRAVPRLFPVTSAWWPCSKRPTGRWRWSWSPPCWSPASRPSGAVRSIAGPAGNRAREASIAITWVAAQNWDGSTGVRRSLS